MAYLPLRNYKYDSGPHRIQSGPDHEGYIVVSSGVRSIGADNGIIVDGTPLSGVAGSGQRWGYDANWRYVPSVPPSAGELLDPTAYQASGTLDAYSYARVTTPVSIAGAKVVSSVESDVTYRNSKHKAAVYYGGSCPDNQNYSPFDTPSANTAAEGKTGGGVTHQLYESPLLTNSLGSQGTVRRSEWQYSQPVYCSVYTQATRNTTKPGLMSTVVRSTYRGGSTSYMTNYGNLVVGDANFQIYEFEDLCTPYPPGLPINTTPFVNQCATADSPFYVGDILTIPDILVGAVDNTFYCDYDEALVNWYNSEGELLGTGPQYTPGISDAYKSIYCTVSYSNDLILSSPQVLIIRAIPDSPSRPINSWAFYPLPNTFYVCDTLVIGDIKTGFVDGILYASYDPNLIEWYRTDDDTLVGFGSSYTITEEDAGFSLYYVVTYCDGTKLTSPPILNNVEFWVCSFPRPGGECWPADLVPSGWYANPYVSSGTGMARVQLVRNIVASYEGCLPCNTISYADTNHLSLGPTTGVSGFAFRTAYIQSTFGGSCEAPCLSPEGSQPQVGWSSIAVFYLQGSACVGGVPSGVKELIYTQGNTWSVALGPRGHNASIGVSGGLNLIPT